LIFKDAKHLTSGTLAGVRGIKAEFADNLISHCKIITWQSNSTGKPYRAGLTIPAPSYSLINWELSSTLTNPSILSIQFQSIVQSKTQSFFIK